MHADPRYTHSRAARHAAALRRAVLPEAGLGFPSLISYNASSGKAVPTKFGCLAAVGPGSGQSGGVPNVRVPETHAIVSQLGGLTSYLPVCRRGIESSCNVAGNGPTHVRRTTVTTYAGIGLLHPHCKHCDSRIQIRTRFPLFCDCGTGRKQDKSAPNVDHFESKAC